MDSNAIGDDLIARHKKANGHDTSGHCQKIIHVPGHKRNSKRIKPYDRICGRDHDEKEAEQENAKEDNNAEMSTSANDDQLVKDAFEFINDGEGYVEHAYFDAAGNLTAGFGIMIDSKAEYMGMDWKANGVSLTDTQKDVNYGIAMSLKSEYGNNMKAGAQEKMKELGTLDKSEARRMAEEHIREVTLPGIRETLSKQGTRFDDLPHSLKIALTDIGYNVGSLNGFPNMLDGIRTGDFGKIERESHRKEPVNNERNEKTAERIRQAAKEWARRKR